MPVLADLFSLGNRVRRKLGDLLNDPVGVLQQSVDNVMPTGYEQRQLFDSQRGQQANPAAVASAQQKMDALARDAALNAITVWHGSPHKFDKFDMSKIGTGEGAQAYGHGLYFAESPKVAEEYAQVLDPLASVAKGSIDADGTAARVLQAVGFDKTRAINELTRRKNMTHVAGDAEWAKKMDDAIAFIRGQDKTSNLYKVDLPDEAVARFLDWDKPLSQQAPEVQAAVKPIMDDWAAKMTKYNPSVVEQYNSGMMDGRLINSAIGDGTQQSAAEVLRSAGIPGIRYLDGGSRGAGTGTSNFVVFDDQLPTILERNGIPLSSLLGK